MDHNHDHHMHNHVTTVSPMDHHHNPSEMGDHDPHANHSSMPDMHDMMMYFHSSVKSTILFKSWQTDSVGGLIGSMIGIFLMAMFYEGLKYYREYLFRKSFQQTNFSCLAMPNEGPKVVPNPQNSIRHRMLHSSHLLQTMLHMIQVTLSYFLMLIFMTYNIWLCLAVVLGAGLGFFIFGWKKAIVVDITEHCH